MVRTAGDHLNDASDGFCDNVDVRVPTFGVDTRIGCFKEPPSERNYTVLQNATGEFFQLVLPKRARENILS
jgi:hypothetical protein